MTFLKKFACVVTLTIAGASAAQAQTAAPLRFFGSAGLTFGGDRLLVVQYEDYDSTIRAGGMIALTAGVEYQARDGLSYQASLGYHFDSTSLGNPDARLVRIPLEVMGFQELAPTWRAGAGLRYVSGAKLTTSGNLPEGTYRFQSSLSPVLEAEYRMRQSFSVKLRYVHEKLEESGAPNRFSANHVGLTGTYYF